MQVISEMNYKENFPYYINDVDKDIQEAIIKAWKPIAPLWPLEKFIAKNSLAGLEEYHFEEALKKGKEYFGQDNISPQMQEVNRQIIKWLQAFFDEGQAVILMPMREKGFYNSWRKLAIFDKSLHQSNKASVKWLRSLPSDPALAISVCCKRLNLSKDQYTEFLTMLLTTLPGWAGFIKYQVEWYDIHNPPKYPVTFADYLAVRIVITTIIWPEAGSAYLDYQPKNIDVSDVILNIQKTERKYKNHLFPILKDQIQNIEKEPEGYKVPKVQIVFCIDVRSEPFRRYMEEIGNYETFSFAGFFGVPVAVKEFKDGAISTSCPVLLKPKHVVQEMPMCSKRHLYRDRLGKKILNQCKNLYYSLKYAFTSNFVLVEAIGPWVSIYLILKAISPVWALKLKKSIINFIRPELPTFPSLCTTIRCNSTISGIEFKDQCHYAESALRIMGLTKNFAKLVVLCAHGSEIQNNPYIACSECGACGSRKGGPNAKILAAILNEEKVREHLTKCNIFIPKGTYFIAAQHNTTTDEVKLYEHTGLPEELKVIIKLLKQDLKIARYNNNIRRSNQFGFNNQDKYMSMKHIALRSANWAETRPEWDLVRNASFIVGPRKITKDIDLDGRAFLHSYEWQQDPNGFLLETILTGSMVVAEWINKQYLFSTIDNVAYGGGSKTTQNITGKIGIMQGNASDLMHGLSVQSLCRGDNERYHEPIRLITLVYAPRSIIDPLIKRQKVLQNLFGNEWAFLVSMDPTDNNLYTLQPDFTWKKEL